MTISESPQPRVPEIEQEAQARLDEAHQEDVALFGGSEAFVDAQYGMIVDDLERQARNANPEASEGHFGEIPVFWDPEQAEITQAVAQVVSQTPHFVPAMFSQALHEIATDDRPGIEEWRIAAVVSSYNTMFNEFGDLIEDTVPLTEKYWDYDESDINRAVGITGTIEHPVHPALITEAMDRVATIPDEVFGDTIHDQRIQRSLAVAQVCRQLQPDFQDFDQSRSVAR